MGSRIVGALEGHLVVRGHLDALGHGADARVVEHPILEGHGVRAAEDEGRRHRVGNGELGPQHALRLGVEHAQPEGDGGDVNACHLVAGEPVLRPERHHGIEGGVIHAAARVELEVVLLDAVALAEAGHRRLGLEALGEERAVDVRRRVVERGESRAMQIEGEDAFEPRAPGIGIADGGAFEGGGPGIGGSHGRREVDDVAYLVGGQVVEPGHRGRRADGAPRAVRVDIGPGEGGAAQARADLVARDHRFEEAAAVRAHFLGHGERAGNDVYGGMASAEPIAFVHLEGHARRGIGEGGEERV